MSEFINAIDFFIAELEPKNRDEIYELALSQHVALVKLQTERDAFRSQCESYKAIMTRIVNCWTPDKMDQTYTQYNLKTDQPGQRGFYEAEFLGALMQARVALEEK